MRWPITNSPRLTDEQQHELKVATSGRLGILTGRPGSGKSFTVAELIREVLLLPGARPVVCAPTGKAAVRAKSLMLDAGITSVEAGTTHRLLQVTRNGHDGRGWGFEYHRDNTLPYTHVIADEASMYGSPLGADLLEACSPKRTSLLLVGDTNQLPPVESGCVLRDLIAAGVPTGELRTIRRNSGAIVAACNAIADAQPWESCDKLDPSSGKNLKHFELADDADQRNQLKRLLAAVPVDPVWDVQVLSPLNEKSGVSRKEINAMMQSILNGKAQQWKKHPFRDGDKIVCTSNSWVFDPTADANEEKIFLANGEVGRVLQSEEKRIFAQFPEPDRVVMIPWGADGNDFELGYCLSVHKSQGSQWPIVICLIDSDPRARMIGSRELWYTALSRAQTACVTIGSRAVIDRDCRRTALQERKTFLREAIVGTESFDELTPV